MTALQDTLSKAHCILKALWWHPQTPLRDQGLTIHQQRYSLSTESLQPRGLGAHKATTEI